MISVDHPPKYLCRITRSDLIKIDRQGNFLPHNSDGYHYMVPLVHPSELHIIIDFFYNTTWIPRNFPSFVVLIFYGDKLAQLQRQTFRGTLSKYGEHFALANVEALKVALLCRLISQRDSANLQKKEFKYMSEGEYPIHTHLNRPYSDIELLFLNLISEKKDESS